MDFCPGFDIRPDETGLSFSYGPDVFGPVAERRHLDDIRMSLLDPACKGPDVPYVVAMDVGKVRDRSDLVARNLLYGAMTYAAGTLGREPVRSQGHIHAVSASCGMSTPEVYEIWEGEAIVLMQETAHEDPGRCLAVRGGAGDVIIVPPGWAHYTVNADPTRRMSFGAWCVRDYGFDYAEIRSRGGLAYFPLIDGEGHVTWVANERYAPHGITDVAPHVYVELGLEAGVPIYAQYERDHGRFDFVARPRLAQEVWAAFRP